MNDAIKGWKELEAFTGLKYQVLRRKIAYYGFPRARIIRKVTANGRICSIYFWSRSEVESWRERKECWTRPLLPAVGSSLYFKWGWRGGDIHGQEKSKS